eukprot:jgi/Chlat1/4663/Chrsp3S05613
MENFARAIAKIVVSQTAQALGFEAIQRSASETLADILLKYLSEVGHSAHAYAEHAGRTESNLFDILLALEGLGTTVEDLMLYVQHADEIPFARALPKFPALRKPRELPTFAETNEEPPSHIPKFLPAFPDPHTYKSTPVYHKRDRDPQKERVARVQEKRQVEDALVRLHDRIGPNTSNEATPGAAQVDPSATVTVSGSEPRPAEGQEELGFGSAAQPSASRGVDRQLSAKRVFESIVKSGKTPEKDRPPKPSMMEAALLPPPGDRPTVGFSLNWARQAKAITLVTKGSKLDASNGVPHLRAPGRIVPSSRRGLTQAEMDAERKRRRVEEIFAQSEEELNGQPSAVERTEL